MKLKGVNKLNKFITNMVRLYICNDIECVFNTEFCIVENKLYYSLFVDEDTDKHWVDWIHDTYKDFDNFSTFVLTFLHEIGHYHTIHNFDWEAADVEKANLVVDLDADTEEEMIAKRRAYWELPIEKAATDWAVNFYKSHRVEMKNFYKDCMAGIAEFYNKNLADYDED